MPFERLRSVLFVPGIRPPMFEKAKTSPADAICLDLEDSVPDAEKVRARGYVAEAIPGLVGDIGTLLIRVNAADTGLLEEDLAAVIQPGVSGISLPKANAPVDILRVDHYLTLLEKTRGIPEGTVRIMPWIESAKGVLACETIVGVSPRVLAASFGAEDFTADLGITRSRTSSQLAAARARVAMACKSVGVIALDTPDPDFRDLEWLAEDSRASHELGFEGRFCIHPNQLPVVNETYQPTAAEIERAQKILAVYDEAVAQGHGAIALEGSMIDMPIVERARRLLARAGISK